MKVTSESRRYNSRFDSRESQVRNVFLTGVLIYILALGCSYPFVAGIAYVWIDIAKPQDLLYSFLAGFPFSLVAAIIALGSYVFNKNRNPFRITGIMVLLGLFAGWITLTTYLAAPAIGAWVKWDWAFKALVFTIFIPLLFRTRVQIEALLLTIIFSVTTISFSAAVKTLMGGGGYGSLAIMGGGNVGIGESSTLATVCVMLIPLIHYLYRNSIIFPEDKLFKLVMVGAGISSILTVIGTNARTGIVAGATLLFFYVLQSKRKLLWIVAIVLATGIFQTMNLEGTAWSQRMSTINTYQSDSSAATRVKVWEWTLRYVADHPLGGGFNIYLLNRIVSVDSAGVVQYFPPEIFGGKAFHSIYFEVLGEQGLVGFGLYSAIMLATFARLRRISVFTGRRADQKWASELAAKLAQAQLVLFAGGLFIGIAYQAYMFYVVAITIALGELILQKTAPNFRRIENAQNSASA